MDPGARHLIALLLAQAALATTAAGEPPSPDPATIVAELRTARLVPSEAVAASGQMIDLAAGRLELERGIVIPAAPIAGNRLELVFVGHGRLRFALDDAVETAQLELLTGRRSLDVSVELAVLVLGDPVATKALLRSAPPAAADDDAVEQAERMYGHWTHRARRRGFGADHALFRAGVADPRGRGYVGLWGRSKDIGDFYCRIDPAETEPLALGSFDILEREVEDAEDETDGEQGEPGSGRKARRRIEWIVRAGIWVSSPLPRDGSAPLGSAEAEPESYAIELDLAGDGLTAREETRIRLRPERSGLRTISLSLMEQMKVEEVRDGQGRELSWHRIGGSVHVLLPQPTELGRPVELVLRCRGEPLEQLNAFSFALRDTSHWYPHAGEMDRAVYDLVFRWPEDLQLLASGELVEESAQDGRREQRRRLDVAAQEVSFEIGRFDVVTETAGHVELTVAFNRIRGPLKPEQRQEALAGLKAALLFYESTFGSLPLDRLTVVTVDRGFSQGFLGFLTLSHSLFDASLQPRRQMRLEILAHEMSHQWWGNLVGWAGYRDQWLSEALADYSALLFMRRIAPEEPLYLARHAQDWREALTRRDYDGRKFASLGPVVMGRRLWINRSPAVYEAVVYDKGSVVFSMLSRLLGEEPLQQMLRALVEVVDNRVISTEAFLKALERMSGEDLHPFARQYVFGTGLPAVHYEYAARPRGDGGWLVEGTAHLAVEGDLRFRAVRGAPKGWDVVREGREADDAADWSLLVPFQVTPPGGPAGKDPSVVSGLGGVLEMRGETTHFSIPLDTEPGDLWLDQRGEVLAEFFCTSRYPKSGLRRRAEARARIGDGAVAEALFRRALDAAVPDRRARDSERVEALWESEGDLQDAAIHLGLARLHLEGGRDGAAAAALDRADGLAGADDEFLLGERVVLRSRLDLRAARYAPAFHRLFDYLMAHPAVQDRGVSDKLGPTTWIVDEVEALALLSIAATKTKRWDVAAWATEAAERFGADMRALADDQAE